MVMDLRLARAVEEQRAEETAAGKGPAAAGLVLGGEALRGLKPCCVHLELLRKCGTKSDCSNTFKSHNHTVLHTHVTLFSWLRLMDGTNILWKKSTAGVADS